MSVSVFVGGLGDDVDKADLEREFGKYGELSKVWVAQNPPGFAFVEYTSMEDATEAIDAMNGALINNSRIRVELSRSSGRRGRRGSGRFDDRGSRGGGYRGDRGGGGGGFQSRSGGYSSGRGAYDSCGTYGRETGYGRNSDDTYGNRYGSSGSQYSSSYGSGAPSYDGMGDSGYQTSGYRSRSPVADRNSSNW